MRFSPIPETEAASCDAVDTQTAQRWDLARRLAAIERYGSYNALDDHPEYDPPPLYLVLAQNLLGDPADRLALIQHLNNVTDEAQPMHRRKTFTQY